MDHKSEEKLKRRQLKKVERQNHSMREWMDVSVQVSRGTENQEMGTSRNELDPRRVMGRMCMFRTKELGSFWIGTLEELEK